MQMKATALIEYIEDIFDAAERRAEAIRRAGEAKRGGTGA